METKHTPGPWRIIGVDGLATAIWGPKAEDVVSERAPMRQEDARLIAAAPDLLDALRMLMDATIKLAPYPPEVSEAVAAIVGVAGDAIKKATT